MKTFKEFKEVDEYVQFAPAAAAGAAAVARGLSKINPSTIGSTTSSVVDKVRSTASKLKKSLSKANVNKNKVRRNEDKKTLTQLYKPFQEKDEHKKSKSYKKLSPKMKSAVDEIFAKMDSKPSDFINTFEKTIKEISKKYKVPEKQLMGYFEKEMLAF